MKSIKTKEIFIEVEIIRVTKKRPARQKPPPPKQSAVFETGGQTSVKNSTFAAWFFDKILRRT